MSAVLRLLRSLWVALALIIAVVLLDVALGRTEHTFLTPILLGCPALAAATARPWAVAALGGLVLGVRQWMAWYDGALADLGTGSLYYMRTLGYVAVTLAAMYVASHRVRREHKLAAVTSVATVAQQTILRTLPATVADMRIGLRYVSAAHEARVGGDLYEVITTQFGTRILIGDVKGSGLGAVYAASIVLGAFRAVAYDEPDLARIAATVDATVYRHLPSDDFVTALFVQIGPTDLRLLHRGHVPALLLRADRGVTSLEPPDAGPPLGLSHLVTTRPVPWTVPFGPADTLVLYTDGVIEARGPAGFYRLADRISALIDEDLDASAARIHSDLLHHTGRALTDDAVVLLLARV